MRTTVYINISRYKRLERTSFVTGCSPGRIAIVLMNRFKVRNKRSFTCFKAVRYQKPIPGIPWMRMHLDLNESEYEHFIQLRCQHKLSVSHMLAIAIDQYLDKLLAEGMDNYKRSLFPVFIYDLHENKNDIEITIFHGVPPG